MVASAGETDVDSGVGVAVQAYGRGMTLAELDLYVRNLDGWAQMYVEGVWTLEQFERHADYMREAMFGRNA